jgi:hypothetical protein
MHPSSVDMARRDSQYSLALESSGMSAAKSLIWMTPPLALTAAADVKSSSLSAIASAACWRSSKWRSATGGVPYASLCRSTAA